MYDEKITRICIAKNGAQHCSSLCSQSKGHGYIAKNVIRRDAAKNVIFTPYAKDTLRQTSAPQKERKKVYTKEDSGVHLLLKCIGRSNATPEDITEPIPSVR